NNPSSIGLPGHCAAGETEYLLPSADKIDVLFKLNGWDIGVEVKAHNAVDDDLQRGVFQCVKYRELLRATRRAEGAIPQARSLLVVQRKLPAKVEFIAKLLNVQWCVVKN